MYQGKYPATKILNPKLPDEITKWKTSLTGYNCPAS